MACAGRRDPQADADTVLFAHNFKEDTTALHSSRRITLCPTDKRRSVGGIPHADQRTAVRTQSAQVQFRTALARL